MRFDPDEPVVPRLVEEVFIRFGRLFHLHVGGHVIQTTPEHPFWVDGKGWVPASELRIGDRLASHNGPWLAVEDLLDTGEYATVYNLRVAEHHTYFVGRAEWAASVWAHNAYDGNAANQDLEASGLGGTKNPKTKAALAELANTGNVDALAAKLGKLRPHGGPAEIRRLALKMVDGAAGNSSSGGTGRDQGDRFTSNDSASEQFEGIQRRQQELREEGLGEGIASIEKSRQRERNRFDQIRDVGDARDYE